MVKKPLTEAQVKLLFPMFEKIVGSQKWYPEAATNLATMVVIQMKRNPIFKHAIIPLYEVEAAAIAFLNFRQ